MKTSKNRNKIFLFVMFSIALIFGLLAAGCEDPNKEADGITYTAAQVGGQSGSITSTGIKLSFKSAVSGLTKDNINISGEVTRGI
ncbi:hypothetical protein AGMMS50212_02300 [Spirochaetia bacterium]|nr:hypothetical protein AGMMS50212_02300 [Spirochaetia bacterium]